MTAAPYLQRYRERRAGSDGALAPLAHRRVVAAPPRQDGEHPHGWHETTHSPEITVDGHPADQTSLDLHLVRHGETQSYLADAGLTPRGTWQSRRCGQGLAAEVRDGEIVRLLCAPTARAAQTADQVRLGLEDGLAACGRDATVLVPEPSLAFRNFQLLTPAGVLDPTSAAGEYRSALSRPAPRQKGARPLWQLELSRFWVLQSGGGDPIEYWMTSPLLTFEPPAAVVRRLWAGAVRLAASAPSSRHTRVVCCTHSGPMRAFATWALGHDAGEPSNTEQVRVRLWHDRGRALVTYRGRTQEINEPPVREGTPWWDLPDPPG
ncbi:MAG TPA: histidine phosphatase family protein [Candidatus Dormibacteraeota bacterium]|nr:histidine phosphatase family protein [Candidatus Dormibacteraeota bacterium]